MNLRLYLAFALALGSLLGRSSQAASPGAFSFVQLCDPQLGFTDYAAELKRFEQAIQQINASDAEFVVICGDLVHHPGPKTYRDFSAAKAALRMPCYYAPGNHDLGNDAKPAALEFYRKTMGKDYFSFEHKGCVFVVANSQLWKASVAGESEKHDEWFKTTLAEAAKTGRPIFVVCHYLPFEKDPDEPEAYFNLAPAKRRELLALCEKSGVVAILAGHSHQTRMLEYHGIQIVASETTSSNFDKRPFGFRLWKIGAARPYQHQFVPLASNEKAPSGSEP